MKLTEKVASLIGDESSVKILSSISEDGKLHSIVVGTMMHIEADKLCAFEVFMDTTSKNIQANKDVAILVVKGMESYLVNATATERYTEGKLYDVFSESLIKKGLPIKALWVFEANEVFDQGASPNAGTKIGE